MSNELTIFNNDKFGNIRVQKDEDGEPLFCLADVCRALDIIDPSSVSRQVISEFGIPVLKTGMVLRPDGSYIHANFITEQQLYFVMNRSDKPNAKPFRMWVNTKVLPSIRKTGSYSLTKSNMDIAIYSEDPLERGEAIVAMLKEERAKQLVLTQQKEQAEQERDAAEELVGDVMQDPTTYSATEIAKDLGLKSAQKLNKWLQDIGFHYKQGKKWLPYAKYSDQGLVDLKLEDTKHGFKVKTEKFTNKGKMWILEKWKGLQC